MKQSKQAIYEQYGIQYENGKIFHPVFGWINPLLVNGNAKLGKGVWTFSTLPTNKEYTVTLATVAGPQEFTVKGTCPCCCEACYATKGFYNMPSVITSLAMKTWIARNDVDFMTRAILAQIKADGILICRIHASGDFCSAAYTDAWRRIVAECPETVFWTYTKNAAAESAFDDLANVNVVKSIIHGYGFNFGHCDYIIRVYKALKAAGRKVHICRCGIDKNQHCTNCHGCVENEIVLFVEHSTDYKAEQDPAYAELKALIDSQDK